MTGNAELQDVLKKIASYHEGLAKKMGELDGMTPETAASILRVMTSTSESKAKDFAKTLHSRMFESSYGDEPTVYPSRIDADALSRLSIPLMAASKAGKSPGALIETLGTNLNKGILKPGDITSMTHSLVTAAEHGHDPYDLTDPLIAGLTSGNLSRRNLRRSAEQIRKALEDSKEFKSLSRTLATGLALDTVKERSLPRSLRMINAGMDALRGDDKANSSTTYLLALEHIFIPHAMDQKTFHSLHPRLVDAAKKRYAYELAYLLSQGLCNHSIKKKQLPAYLDHFDRFFARVKDSGGDVFNLSKILTEAISHKLIDEKTMGPYSERFKQILDTAEKAGHDRQDVRRGMESAFSVESLKPRHMPMLLSGMEASARAGHNPGNLAEPYARGIKIGLLNARTLPRFNEHIFAHADKYDPGTMTSDAIKLYGRFGGFVPLVRVMEYQREFIDKGHYPTINSVVNFHQRVGRKR